MVMSTGATVFNDWFQMTIGIITVIIGLSAIFLIFRINRQLGGRISQALRFFTAGVLCNVSAVIWTLVYGHSLVIGSIDVNIHQNLMSIGMIFFIISTTRFAKLIQ